MATDDTPKKPGPPPPLRGKEEDSRKTPAFGLRRLSPLRDALDGRPPDDIGPVRVKRRDADPNPQEEPEEEAYGPSADLPEHTARVVLSAETMRVTLERAARNAELAAREAEVPIIWGGGPAPEVLGAKDGELRAPAPKAPLALRLILAVLLVASLLGTGIAASKAISGAPALAAKGR
jgi:hypothetical protein